MKINYWKNPFGNFGDDLNLLLWPEIFGDIETTENNFEIWGIGSLLDNLEDGKALRIVMGAGSAGRHIGRVDTNWDFRWVRGPLTARALNIPESKGLGDPACLWSGLKRNIDYQPQGPIGIIPHFRTWQSFDWSNVAKQAGMIAINPMQAPELIAEKISLCSKIMAESLHAGIFADTIGVPWAPIVMAHRFNAFKWRDWLATVGREFNPFVLSRPLCINTSLLKCSLNRLATLVNYSSNTFKTELRPIRNATDHDIAVVIAEMQNFGKQEKMFFCSDKSKLLIQKNLMLEVCEQTAEKYKLNYTNVYF